MVWHDTRRWSKCNCWKVWNQVCEWRNTFLFLDEIESKCSKQTSRCVVRTSPNVLSKQGSQLWDSYQTFCGSANVWWISGLHLSHEGLVVSHSHLYANTCMSASIWDTLLPLVLFLWSTDEGIERHPGRQPAGIQSQYLEHRALPLRHAQYALYNIYRTIKLNDVIFQHVYVCMFPSIMFWNETQSIA